MILENIKTWIITHPENSAPLLTVCGLVMLFIIIGIIASKLEKEWNRRREIKRQFGEHTKMYKYYTGGKI